MESASWPIFSPLNQRRAATPEKREKTRSETRITGRKKQRIAYFTGSTILWRTTNQRFRFRRLADANWYLFGQFAHAGRAGALKSRAKGSHWGLFGRRSSSEPNNRFWACSVCLYIATISTTYFLLARVLPGCVSASHGEYSLGGEPSGRDR